MKTRSLTLFVALTLLLSACGAAPPTPLSSTESAESAVAPSSSAATSTHPSVETPTSVPPTESADSAVASTSSAATSTHSLVEERVEDLLARMTLDEKIGQMTQVEKNSIKPGDITKYFIGSILSGGGGSPDGNNTPEGWADMINGFQDEALATRLGIPIIYGVDAVHGHGNLRGATHLPAPNWTRCVKRPPAC